MILIDKNTAQYSIYNELYGFPDIDVKEIPYAKNYNHCPTCNKFIFLMAIIMI